AQCIDEEMALPAFDELAAVIAADAARFLDGLHALAVHNRRARVRMAAGALTFCTVQGRIDRVQSVLAAESPEMVIHGLPGGKILGEIAPGAAGAQHVEDGVEDAAQGMCAWSASR